MKQAIAGVSPASLGEVTIMTVWPTLAARAEGRFFGRLYLLPAGVRLFGVPITVGHLLAVASIPLILPLYFWMLLPVAARRYRLTNRRVVVQRGLKPVDERSVPLGRFDTIEVQVLPGQQWYPAGDLVFKLGQVETFRLPGVSRPEAFRQVCIKAQLSFVGVQKAREASAAV